MLGGLEGGRVEEGRLEGAGGRVGCWEGSGGRGGGLEEDTSGLREAGEVGWRQGVEPEARSLELVCPSPAEGSGWWESCKATAT